MGGKDKVDKRKENKTTRHDFFLSRAGKKGRRLGTRRARGLRGSGSREEYTNGKVGWEEAEAGGSRA